MKKHTKKSTQSHSTQLTKALSKYLHLDDPWVVDVVLATVVANAMEGDPLWVLIVNPSSSGKTEFVQLFSHVPWCEWLAEITENTLLSGLQAPAEEAENNRTYSLLHRWTDPKLRAPLPPVRVMLIQDLTGLITQNKQKRDAIFGQLRQVYDGRFVKSTGMGEDLEWEGYLGCLGAVTPVIDTVLELSSILGERFILYRPYRGNSQAEAIKAFSRKSSDWRTEVARLAQGVVEKCLKEAAQITIPKKWQQRVINLAQFIARGRTAIAKDGYTKALKYLPQPEGPGRLTGQLRKLLQGLCVVRGRTCPSEQEMAILAKHAKDSIPALRLSVIETLWEQVTMLKKELEGITLIPSTTLTYELENLQVLGIAQEVLSTSSWRLTPEFRTLCEQGRVFPVQKRNKCQKATTPEQAA